MEKIAVYCEVDLNSKKIADVSYELISKAYELTKKVKELSSEEYIVEAIALCDELDEQSIDLAYKAGASRFVHIKDECLKEFCQTIFAKCFLEYFEKNPASVLLFGATQKGRIVAPRITTALNTGLVADCTQLDFIVRDKVLSFAPTRPTFGSELMATILSKKNPQCATVRPKTFKACFDVEQDREFSEFSPNSFEENRIKLARSIRNAVGEIVDFSKTKTVLVAGYGLVDQRDRKYFSRLEKIAQMTNSSIGATRKVVDLGFMPHQNQIGQTGATVEADLYIAFGVSGAIQHIAGMKNCKTIIAINTDENAEIFKYCDYKIVADAKEIIDELLKEFM